MAILLVAWLGVTAGCATRPHRPSEARLADVNRLAVVAEGDGAFEVVAARLKDLGPAPQPVLLGGWGSLGGLGVLAIFLVAAAVHEGVAASEDASTAAALRPHIGEMSPRSVSIDTFVRTLRSGGRFEVEVLEREPVREERRRFDAVVLLRFPAFGFTLLRVDRPSLSAFVEADVRMVLATSGATLWEEKDALLVHGRYTMDDLRADPELARRELRSVLETAGYRLAVELLYPRGEP